MLNLTIVMLAQLFGLPRAAALFLALTALLFLSGRPLFAQAQSMEQATPQPTEVVALTEAVSAKAKIYAPADGDALQGVVSVRGWSDVPGFRSAELSFAYQSNPAGTWFLLYNSQQPVTAGAAGSAGILAGWDTTTITDGNYRLRMQIFLEDGQVIESVVDGLRVRNYTPVETSTPAAPVEIQQPLPSIAGRSTATHTPQPASDYQPAASDSQSHVLAATNPAQITRGDLGSSAACGVLVVFGALLLTVIYLGLRSLLRR